MEILHGMCALFGVLRHPSLCEFSVASAVSISFIYL